MDKIKFKIINDAANAAGELRQQFPLTTDQIKKIALEDWKETTPYLPERMDKIAYWTEEIKHLQCCPEKTLEMGRAALKAWQEAEKEFLLKLKKSRSDILQDFLKFRDLLERPNDSQSLPPNDSAAVLSNTSSLLLSFSDEMKVWNVGWIHAFSWIFPKVDPANRVAYREVGKMMVASFYVWFIKDRNYEFPEALTSELGNLEFEYLYAFSKPSGFTARLEKAVSDIVADVMKEPYSKYSERHLRERGHSRYEEMSESEAATLAHEDFLSTPDVLGIPLRRGDPCLPVCRGGQLVCKEDATDFFRWAAKYSPALIKDEVVHDMCRLYWDCIPNGATQMNILIILGLLKRKDCIGLINKVISSTTITLEVANEAKKTIQGEF